MKGLFSLDAIIAMLMMLFLVLWSQGFVSMTFDNINFFGINYEVKAEAIRVGSLMNTFYATNPSSDDYMTIVPSSMRLFKNTSQVITVLKCGCNPEPLNISIQSKFGSVNATYPVASVALNNTTWRVTS